MLIVSCFKCFNLSKNSFGCKYTTLIANKKTLTKQNWLFQM